MSQIQNMTKRYLISDVDQILLDGPIFTKLAICVCTKKIIENIS